MMKLQACFFNYVSHRIGRRQSTESRPAERRISLVLIVGWRQPDEEDEIAKQRGEARRASLVVIGLFIDEDGGK